MMALTFKEIEQEIAKLSDEDRTLLAGRILRRELGVAGLIRFMQALGLNRGNWTEERKEALKDLSLEEIIESARKFQRARDGEDRAPEGERLFKDKTVEELFEEMRKHDRDSPGNL